MSDAYGVRCIIVFLLCTFCGGVFSACAFTDRHVNLAPPQAIPQVAAVPASQTGKIVSVARPVDLRVDPMTVGNINNGYGWVTAQIRSNTDVPMWVANSLIMGLEQAGYRVERVETVETAQTPLVIDVAVSRVFTEHSPSFLGFNSKADVAAQVEVYKQGQKIFRRMYVGKYEAFNVFTTTSANEYQGMLDEAMTDFLQKAVPDLTTSLGKAMDTAQRE